MIVHLRSSRTNYQERENDSNDPIAELYLSQQRGTTGNVIGLNDQIISRNKARDTYILYRIMIITTENQDLLVSIIVNY